MQIKEIQITGIGGIKDLHLTFNPRMNILCGPNSIGKTTVLESIATMFIFSSPLVKRNASCQEGEISAIIEAEGEQKEGKILIKDFEPTGGHSVHSLYEHGRKFLSLKIDRNISYSRLNAVPSDPEKDNARIWEESLNGVNINGFKGWFVNRYLYSAHEGTLSSQQISNFHLAEKCISIINPSYKFSRIKGATNDIMINTPQGEIFYEYLSSGFKSTLSILFSIIKEIEFRFKEHEMTAGEFDGVILIDEIDAHLHPEWQEKIRNVLVETFPRAQFIVTTHSPHVIQTAEPNEVLALCLDGSNGVGVRSDIITSKYGFKGWTIEEILYDVMGMKTLRSKIYHELYKAFGEAVDAEDYQKAKEAYGELEILLHPDNTQRKLLKFQLAKISDV